MEYFVKIYECDLNRFRVFLNSTNSDLFKKFNELCRDEKLVKKFVLVIEAVKINQHNKHQFNSEHKCELGDIYAIKVENHRFYTLIYKDDGYRNLYISRYGRKQTQVNDKKLTAIIQSISKIEIKKIL